MADDPAPRGGGEARPSVFADPLAGWHNDDVLLDKEARQQLGAAHPDALRVLDWPELRALFKQQEGPANLHTRRDRQLSIVTVCAAVLALVLAAAVPIAGSAALLVGGLALVAALATAVVAACQLSAARETNLWLGSRYWTERARALYFQVLINNLDLAARAMTDNAALALWKQTRAQALDALPTARDLPARVRGMARDEADDDVWIVPAWREPPPLPEPSPQLDLLFARLRAQRFDIQLAYSARKLGQALAAPRRRDPHWRRLAQIVTIVAVAAAAGLGLLLVLGYAVHDVETRIAGALACAAVAIALGVRAIGDGLNRPGDLSRYAWYNAAVTQARTQFDAGDAPAKVDALRAMETHAYRDLRDFIAGHARGA